MLDFCVSFHSTHPSFFLFVMKTIWGDCPREEQTFVHMASKDNSRIQEFRTQTVNALEIIHQLIFDLLTRMGNKIQIQLTEDLIFLSLRNFIGNLNQTVQKYFKIFFLWESLQFWSMAAASVNSKAQCHTFIQENQVRWPSWAQGGLGPSGTHNHKHFMKRQLEDVRDMKHQRVAIKLS